MTAPRSDETCNSPLPEAGKTKATLSWKTKAALTVGVAAPLGLLGLADPAAALDESSNDNADGATAGGNDSGETPVYVDLSGVEESIVGNGIERVLDGPNKDGDTNTVWYEETQLTDGYQIDTLTDTEHGSVLVRHGVAGGAPFQVTIETEEGPEGEIVAQTKDVIVGRPGDEPSDVSFVNSRSVVTDAEGEPTMHNYRRVVQSDWRNATHTQGRAILNSGKPLEEVEVVTTRKTKPTSTGWDRNVDVDVSWRHTYTGESEQFTLNPEDRKTLRRAVRLPASDTGAMLVAASDSYVGTPGMADKTLNANYTGFDTGVVSDTAVYSSWGDSGIRISVPDLLEDGTPVDHMDKETNYRVSDDGSRTISGEAPLGDMSGWHTDVDNQRFGLLLRGQLETTTHVDPSGITLTGDGIRGYGLGGFDRRLYEVKP